MKKCREIEINPEELFAHEESMREKRERKTIKVLFARSTTWEKKCRTLIRHAARHAWICQAWRVRGAWKEVRMWLVTGDHERPTFEVGETTAFADLQEVVLRMSNQNVWHRRQSSGTIWNNGKSYSFRKPRKAFSVLICFINKILPSSLAWNSCWNCLEGLRSSSFGQEHFVSWLWYQLFYCYFIRRKQLNDVDEGRRERQLKLSERCVMKA